jgi:hypothetical protein
MAAISYIGAVGCERTLPDRQQPVFQFLSMLQRSMLPVSSPLCSLSNDISFFSSVSAALISQGHHFLQLSTVLLIVCHQLSSAEILVR